MYSAIHLYVVPTSTKEKNARAKTSLTAHQRICRKWPEIRNSVGDNGSDKVHALAAGCNLDTVHISTIFVSQSILRTSNAAYTHYILEYRKLKSAFLALYEFLNNNTDPCHRSEVKRFHFFLKEKTCVIVLCDYNL